MVSILLIYHKRTWLLCTQQVNVLYLASIEIAGSKSLSTRERLDSATLVHTIYLGHSKEFVWLIVDDQKQAIGRVGGKLKALNVAPKIYVGGHETFKTHPSLRGSSSFKGMYSYM